MTENRGLFTTAQAQSYLAEEPEMELEKLSDRLWSISDGIYRTIFLEGEESVVAFDTFGTPGRARAYGRKIADAVPGKEISTVIYSHDHLDHAGFADDLAPNANIIADEMCAKVIKLREAQGQRQPTNVIAGMQNEITIDGIELVLLNPGPTHGTGHLSAWFEEEKLLFSSDTILPNARYGLMPDYHIWNFVKFMRDFLDLDWDTFVPGRYEVTSRAQFEKGCDYIEAIQEETQKAFVEFVPIWVMEAMHGYVANSLKERFGDLDGFDEHIGLTSIRIVHHYLMGGWGLEDTPTPGIILADEVEL
jgi:glyoxylase-like metal-dependent hydrolase (beta-lactamase superfamily II)